MGEVFDIKDVQIVPSKDFEYLTNSDFISKVKRKILKGSAFYEPNLLYHSTINGVTKNVYLEGYFQSERYFSKYRSEIIDLFKFTKEPSVQTQEAIDSISKQNTIAIHIRRGDYQTNKKIKSIHGVLPLSYYKKALEHFDLSNHHILFFSDDIDWVKNHFDFLTENQSTFVNWNTGDDSWQDLYLMSKCHNFIIANSSFSWWGAWLSTHKNKSVICPQTWFADKDRNSLTSDLIPTNWIRV